MKILSVSDIQVPFLNTPVIKERFQGIDLVIDCGDLPASYLDYIVLSLNSRLFYVRGNHAQVSIITETGEKPLQRGGANLHRRILFYRNIWMAGVEGSLRYRPGPFQYTQLQMWSYVLQLVPRLLFNRLHYGRALDVFVSHAPPWGIHDKIDLPHLGIKAFRWLDLVFQPAYHFHGHIHVYRPDEITETRLGKTRVINTFGYKVTEIIPDGLL